MAWRGIIDKAHVAVLKDEAEYVKRRDHAVASKQNRIHLTPKKLLFQSGKRHPSLVNFVRLQTTQTK